MNIVYYKQNLKNSVNDEYVQSLPEAIGYK